MDDKLRSAKKAILEELQWLLAQPGLSDALKQEVWRIQRLSVVEGDGAAMALDEIYNRAMKLDVNVAANHGAVIDLVMPIARYGADVRSAQDIAKHKR